MKPTQRPRSDRIAIGAIAIAGAGGCLWLWLSFYPLPAMRATSPARLSDLADSAIETGSKQLHRDRAPIEAPKLDDAASVDQELLNGIFATPDVARASSLPDLPEIAESMFWLGHDHVQLAEKAHLNFVNLALSVFADAVKVGYVPDVPYGSGFLEQASGFYLWADGSLDMWVKDPVPGVGHLYRVEVSDEGMLDLLRVFDSLRNLDRHNLGMKKYVLDPDDEGLVMGSFGVSVESFALWGVNGQSRPISDPVIDWQKSVLLPHANEGGDSK